MAKLPGLLKQNIKLLDIHAHVGVDPLLYFTHSFPYSHSLRDSFEAGQRVGITHSVVFPWVTSFYYHLPSLMRGKVLLGGKVGRAPFHFENEQMLRQLYEIFPSYIPRYIPFVIVDTLREVRKQVRVLETLLRKYPFYGLKVHPRATQAPVVTLRKDGKLLLEFARAHERSRETPRTLGTHRRSRNPGRGGTAGECRANLNEFVIARRPEADAAISL